MKSTSYLIGVLFILFTANTSVSAISEIKDANDFAKLEVGEQEELLLFFEKEALTTIADLHPHPVGKAPAIVSVITAEQIKNMGARNLAEVLVTVPGIGILTSNAWSRAEIEVRGIETHQSSNKVLILLDGHKLNDPFFGGATTVTDDFPLDNIGQIEIIRGPGSALYGANAFVAVINIVTKKARDIDGLQLNLGLGSFETSRYNILFGKETESGLKLSVNLNYFKTDSQQRAVEEDFLTQTGGLSESPGFTDNHRERYDIQLNLDYGDLGFMGRFISKEHGSLVGARDVLSDSDLMKFNAFYSEIHYKHNIAEGIELFNKMYYDRFEMEFFWKMLPEGTENTPGNPFTNGAIYNGTATEQTLGGDIRLEWELFDRNLLTTGMVFEYISQSDVTTKATHNHLLPSFKWEPLPFEDVTEDANFNRNTNRTVLALYAQDDWEITDKIALTAGVRYDHYDDVGNSVNPRGGLVFSPVDSLDLKFLYGEAFRAPSFEELYNQNNTGVLGNENLNPETLRTLEAGMEYRYNQKLRLSANYFHTEIDDLILLAPDPKGEALNRYQNLDHVRIDGVESEIKIDYSPGNYAYINYSFQRAVKVETKRRLSNTPMHRGNVGLNLALGKYVNLQPHLFLSAARPRTYNDSRDPLGEYALVDVAAVIKNFYKTMEVRASIHNLLDREYANPAPTTLPGGVVPTLPGDYPQQGRDFFVEAVYKF